MTGAMTGAGWLDPLAQDLRYAIRRLRAAPIFTLTAVATLAVGIGATTAIFSTVNAALLRPLPYARPDELVHVLTRYVDGRATGGAVSPLELGALSALPMVARVGSFSASPFEGTLVHADGTVVNVAMTGVTEGFFEVLGLPMAAGRPFSHEEYAMAGRDAPFVVVLSYRAWSTLFGRDPGVVGRVLDIPEIGTAATVVGVAPPSLEMPRTDFWFNFRVDPQAAAHWLTGLVRLRPGATVAQLRGAAAVAMEELGRTVTSDEGREFVAQPLAAALVGDLRSILLIVLGATALLLALAAANVANLVLARGATRGREVAVRAALGASRGRVVRQLLTEALVLAACGAAAGLALAYGAVQGLLVLGASKLPRLEAIPIDGHVLLFALGMLLATGLVMGVVPALRLAGSDVRTLLNEGGRGATAGRGTSRLMSGVLAAEIALAVVLVAGAGWLVQSFNRLHTLQPGFVPDGRLVVQIRTPRALPTVEQSVAWADELLARVRAVAGDAVVGSGPSFPFRADRDGTTAIDIGGADEAQRERSAYLRTVTPSYFEAMGTRLLAGRRFTVDDRADTRPVVIVNRAFVRQYLGDRDPLTATVFFGSPHPDRRTTSQIVGVVDDVRYKSLTEDAEPTVYLPIARGLWPSTRQSIVVATHGRPEALVPAIRAELQRFDPQLVVAFSTARAIVDETLGRQELGTTLMAIFGLTALTLMGVGIYGLIAYAVAQRSREIAVRLALGASRPQAFWLVASAAQRLAAIGVIAGLAVAYAAGSVAASSVFEMRASDPLVLAGAAAIVALVTVAAAVVPAIRASRLEPARALHD